jgi:hypothetical protein
MYGPGEEIKRLVKVIKDENPDVDEIILEGATEIAELPVWEFPWLVPGKITYTVTVEFSDGDFFTTDPYDDFIEALEKTRERLGKWLKT